MKILALLTILMTTPLLADPVPEQFSEWEAATIRIDFAPDPEAPLVQARFGFLLHSPQWSEEAELPEGLGVGPVYAFYNIDGHMRPAVFSGEIGVQNTTPSPIWLEGDDPENDAPDHWLFPVLWFHPGFAQWINDVKADDLNGTWEGISYDDLVDGVSIIFEE